MLKNYLVTSLRRMIRQKGSTLINLLGLSLGMVSCLFIFLIIQYETGFDRFHSRLERICRIVTDEQSNGITSFTMGSPLPMARALQNDFPVLEQATSTAGLMGGLFEVRDADGSARLFEEKETVGFAEPAFFALFNFPWIAGTPASLAEPNMVALTESVAMKFFGTTNVLGRTLRLDHKVDLTVAGIMKDFPAQTDFNFTVLVSLKTLPVFLPGLDSWRGLSSNVNTFVLLPPGFPAAELEARLPAFKNKYLQDNDDPNRRVHHVQPLAEIHYDWRYGNFAQHTISRAMLLALGLVGLFVLVTACINFVNMATAQAMTRAREVGVRKVLGAVRSRLVAQYLGETLLLTVLSALVALALAELLLPSVNTLTGLRLSLSLSGNPVLLLLMLFLIAAVNLLAGFYPALVLSGFSPSLALKGQADRAAGSGVLLRRGLVVVQFVISQMLLIGTIVVAAQLNYWRSTDLGFTRETLVTVELPENDGPLLDRLRTELLRDSHIRNVSFGYASAASGNVWDTAVRHTLHGAEEAYITDLKWADDRYVETYGLRFVAGRNYMAADTATECVVNETFARRLGLAPQDIIGKTFRLGKRIPYPVVGVVRDFHTRPLHDEIRPCLLAPQRRFYQLATLRLDAADLQGALAHLETSWKAVYPGYLYSFRFMDQRIEEFYVDEQKISDLFRVLTSVAIFIGMIGLFGLVSFIAARRTKEIGVRKVLGAGVLDILWLFAREFTLLILIAFAVAAPVAYLVMNRWLEDFAYRITPGIGVFALSIAATFAVAALSVGYRVLRASLSNPVEALRYE